MAKWLRRALWVALLGGLVLGSAGYFYFKTQSGKNPSVLSLPGGAVGILQGIVYSWVVPVKGGVVLIDAGGDPGAPNLLAELKRRNLGPGDVKAILITHGHFDHVGGTAAFPKAPIYIQRPDLPLLRGEVNPKHWLVRFITFFRKPLPPPARLVVLNGKENILIGDDSFQTVAIAGHTPGSLMFLWRGVLFTGDSLQTDDKGRLRLPPEMFSDDLTLLKKELKEKIPQLSFSVMATSHTGLVSNPKAAWEAFQ